MNDIYTPKLSKVPGYWHIPKFTKYIVNESGDVINTVTKHHMKPSEMYGYKAFHLTDDYGRARYIKRSRLLCMVFKPIPNPEKMCVDHINCDKSDDRLCNLEWVTSRENSIRAGLNGLMGKLHPIETKNFYTGEVKTYKSINDAARCLNLSVSALDYRLHAPEGKVFPEGLQYRELSPDKDWEEAEHDESLFFLYGNKKRVLLKFLDSGEVKEFDTLSDAAKYIKMPTSTLSCYLSKSETKQPILPELIQLKFAKDNRGWIDYDDPWIEMAKITGRPLIQVQNDITGDKRIFKSQADCAREMGCLTTTLNNRLRMRDNTVVYKDGYRYGYYPYK